MIDIEEVVVVHEFLTGIENIAYKFHLWYKRLSGVLMSFCLKVGAGNGLQ